MENFLIAILDEIHCTICQIQLANTIYWQYNWQYNILAIQLLKLAIGNYIWQYYCQILRQLYQNIYN